MRSDYRRLALVSADTDGDGERCSPAVRDGDVSLSGAAAAGASHSRVTCHAPASWATLPASIVPAAMDWAARARGYRECLGGAFNERGIERRSVDGAGAVDMEHCATCTSSVCGIVHDAVELRLVAGRRL